MTFLKVQQPARPFGSLLDELFQDLPAFRNKEGVPAVQSVPVNIVETADGYHLELNAPGRIKEDFRISVENDLLTISYEHKEENKSEDLKIIRKEFKYSSFKRSFSLDEKINAENIQAKYENGLLKLYLPKKAEVKQEPRAITIQ
ncbi:Hsp20/alpha crystallin family protein [Flavihumibacter stibioxidans]|uniref:Heat-shock protein Hsp20 n=1 Tax=Flavihumibacter stibioxidans TaxID=1834163 RepID=A0ABR7M3A3_9BACT|nr:Hsp20/alpha crystallin family protein [Flavihumibacter stibioxidans]MBC6489416.1 heat-shock protein Hsp20 [Flavihumibacter stibioxidans]